MDAGLATALDWGFKIAALFGGWFLKVLFDKLKALEVADSELAKAVSELRVALPTIYAPRTEIRDLGDDLFAFLRRIEDKVDKKQDRKD